MHYNGEGYPSLDLFLRQYIDFALFLSSIDNDILLSILGMVDVVTFLTEQAFDEYLMLYGTDSVPYIFSDDEMRRTTYTIGEIAS